MDLEEQEQFITNSLYHFSLLLRNICRAIQLRYTPKKP